jgi:hypothetical protein
MKNQTAVEYLVEQLMPKALSAEQHYHIEYAKELEKQNIMNAWVKGVTSGNNMTAEKYYKETFNK